MKPEEELCSSYFHNEYCSKTRAISFKTEIVRYGVLFCGTEL